MKPEFHRRGLRLAAMLLALVVATPVYSVDELPRTASNENGVTGFTRVTSIEDGRPGALQLAIVTYVPRHGTAAFSVDLISTIHIADAAYYAGLNRRFREYDAVLYELVAPDSTMLPRRDAEHSGFVSGAQLALKNALGLSFQLDEIDYGGANFVHADLTSAELGQAMVDREESLYVYFWRLVYAAFDEYARDPLGTRQAGLLSTLLAPDPEHALKVAVAQQMTDMDRVQSAIDGESGSALIGARNARAIDVLRAQLEAGKKRIGIFYGAAHMQDMEQRLLSELALHASETEWLDAWNLAPRSTGAAQ